MRRPDNLTTFIHLLSRNSGILDLLQHKGSLQASYVLALTPSCEYEEFRYAHFKRTDYMYHGIIFVFLKDQGKEVFCLRNKNQADAFSF